VPAGLWIGGAIFVLGLAVTFVGNRLRGRVLGFVIAALGAVLAVGATSARPAWLAAVTVAATLVPLLSIAAQLAKRVEHVSVGRRATLDDDPR
jgi:hypothetical protein